MTIGFFLLLMLSESCTIAGQVFFKRVMGAEAISARRRRLGIAAGIAAMAIGFFLWLGILKRFELSYLYPFEGFDRIILVVAATVFLKERMSPSLWAGMVLIILGTVLVSLS